MKYLMILSVTASLAMAGCSPGDVSESGSKMLSSGFSPYVDKQGNISRPDNFRENWVHLGTWFVREDDHASGPGVHDVYATPESVEGFKKNGQWPDATVLIKTVSGIEEKKLSTGNAQWAGDIGVWFVMVRDRENRFPGNKAWGEGWGWALFKADAPKTNVTTTWHGEGFNNCFGCHVPVKNTEWVYIDGYPTVRGFARYPELDGASE